MTGRFSGSAVAVALETGPQIEEPDLTALHPDLYLGRLDRPVASLTSIS
jgi:hypothetical protein